MASIVRIEMHGEPTRLRKKPAELLARIIRERTGARVEIATPGDVILRVEAKGGPEGFRIEDGPKGAVTVTGHDARGLIYGVGKLLREADWGRGRFKPGAWRGVSVPQKPVRAMYFATHFHNYYHDAPVGEVVRYIEELALWGCNVLIVWFDMHHYRGLRDPAAQAMVKRLRTLLTAANAVGMGGGLVLLANEGFDNSPPRLRAKCEAGRNGYFAQPGAFYHREICPSTPGGLREIRRERRAVLEAFAGVNIEYLWSWPYDQGGCTCRACAPWGVNGFLRSSEAIAKLARQYWPQVKLVLSTWYFDHFTNGEWAGLSRAFAQGAPKWVDCLLADDFHGFPQYPLQHGVPGKLAMAGFPEISMLGAVPWGGFGANPRPAHWQDYWDTCGDRLAGGFPYSEGIYEDLNKVMLLQLNWSPQRTTADIVQEYAAYEYGREAAPGVVTACQLMEAGLDHSGIGKEAYVQFMEGNERLLASVLPKGRFYVAPRLYEPRRYLDLLQAAEARMTPSARRAWRWRILRLRADIDAALYESGGAVTRTSERAMAELIRIYHAQHADWILHPPAYAWRRQLHLRGRRAKPKRRK